MIDFLVPRIKIQFFHNLLKKNELGKRLKLVLIPRCFGNQFFLLILIIVLNWKYDYEIQQDYQSIIRKTIVNASKSVLRR